MKNTIVIAVGITLSFGVMAADVLMGTVNGHNQSLRIGARDKIAFQCRATATNNGTVRYRLNSEDAGINLTSDPEIAFVLSDGTRLDPYTVKVPAGKDRITIGTSDAGVPDCSVFAVFP
jgi:hypothetical protein